MNSEIEITGIPCPLCGALLRRNRKDWLWCNAYLCNYGIHPNPAKTTADVLLELRKQGIAVILDPIERKPHP